MDFSDIKGVVIDMDGVLWRGSMPLPGLVDFFDMLKAQRLPFVLATNNSGKTPADYLGKLAQMGVNGVPESAVITSGTTTVAYMQAHYSPDTTVYVLGENGLIQLITEAGYRLVDSGARVVVAGIDFNLTYDKLRRAGLMIRAGADFIGTNPDRTFPNPEGLVPGAGSILAALEAATDRSPIIVGKPHAPMFTNALHILGTTAKQTLMIGDRLTTDIQGAQQQGLHTALMMTGVTSPAELAASAVQPDSVHADLPALIQAWTG